MVRSGPVRSGPGPVSEEQGDLGPPLWSVCCGAAGLMIGLSVGVEEQNRSINELKRGVGLTGAGP